MSVNTNKQTEEATPTYLRGGDPALADYYPAWLDNLADDVTLEGSMMDGAVQGTDAVRAVLVAIRSLYDEQEFHFAGAYGENGFLEDYTAQVAGEIDRQLHRDHPQRRRPDPAHRGQLPAPERAPAPVPADRRALRRHSIRRTLRHRQGLKRKGRSSGATRARLADAPLRWSRNCARPDRARSARRLSLDLAPEPRLFLAGGIVSGAGSGAIFRGSPTIVISVSGPDDRAGVLATFLHRRLHRTIDTGSRSRDRVFQHVTPRMTLLVFAPIVRLGILAAAPVLVRPPLPIHNSEDLP